MLCTMKIKLIPDAEQHRKLLETMKRFNEISRIAFENKTFSKVKIQKLCYYDIREKFGLSAQMVVRAIGKVAESYKTDKKWLHTFKETGAIEDPMIISKYHQGIMQGNRIRRQADLILQDVGVLGVNLGIKNIA
jgi:predicted transposase